jgi:hypothetical protein
LTPPGVSASLTSMTDEPTVAGLQQRITELEEQVAELTGQLHAAGEHPHADPGEDKEWGEFNPG